MAIYTAKQFSVDSEGAYLVDLYSATGEPILFPRTTIDGKRRGGSHVCLPYFGVDAAGVLPQHGFGRDAEWQVEVLSDQVIECSYLHSEKDMFSGLKATLRYELERANSFKTTLTVTNAGDVSFPVTPGFHPYFAVEPGSTLLDGKKANLADFEPYKDHPAAGSMTIESSGHTVTVASESLAHMVVWTSLQADFLCVEPTHSGHSFNSAQPSSAVLDPADTVVFSYTISWL